VSDQRWKIYLFVALLFVGSTVTLLQGFLYEPLGRERAMQVAIAGMLLVVGAFVWAASAIRCPQCQLKLFVHAIRKEGFFAWFAWLLQAEHCPQCGHPPAPPSAGPRRKVKGLRRR
jgi:hypothetical protein